MPMNNNNKFRSTTTNKVIQEQKKPMITTKRLNIKRPTIMAHKTRYNNPGEENRYRNTHHHRSYSHNYDKIIEEEAEPGKIYGHIDSSTF